MASNMSLVAIAEIFSEDLVFWMFSCGPILMYLCFYFVGILCCSPARLDWSDELHNNCCYCIPCTDCCKADNARCNKGCRNMRRTHSVFELIGFVAVFSMSLIWYLSFEFTNLEFARFEFRRFKFAGVEFAHHGALDHDLSLHRSGASNPDFFLHGSNAFLGGLFGLAAADVMLLVLIVCVPWAEDEGDQVSHVSQCWCCSDKASHAIVPATKCSLRCYYYTRSLASYIALGVGVWITANELLTGFDARVLPVVVFLIVLPCLSLATLALRSNCSNAPLVREKNLSTILTFLIGVLLIVWGVVLCTIAGQPEILEVLVIILIASGNGEERVVDPWLGG